MKSEILRCSSSIVSRAPCAGALYRWKVNLFPETRRGTLDFIVPQMYPPNSSDLNLVDYAIWDVKL